MWDLDSAVDLVRIIHPVVFQSGFNPHFGGSLCYDGKSEKDLDLVLLRRPQVLTTDVASVLTALANIGFYEYKCNNLPFRTVYKLLSKKAKADIDLIVLELDGQTEPYLHTGSEEAADLDWVVSHSLRIQILRAKALHRLDRNGCFLCSQR